MLKGVVENAITVLLVGCAIAVSYGTLSKGGAATPVEDRPIENWEELIASGHRVGSPDAPVQIAEFVDLQCPYCARFHETLERTLARFGDDVAWTFIHYPIASHPEASVAALAVECAAVQGALWEFVGAAFERQEEFSTGPWLDIAEDANVPNLDEFDQCMVTGPVVHPRISTGAEMGDKLRISGTPSVAINGWLKARVPHEFLDSLVMEVLDAR